jgi:hypothetical protein
VWEQVLAVPWYSGVFATMQVLTGQHETDQGIIKDIHKERLKK